MKRLILVAFLMAMFAVASFAQVTRVDVSAARMQQEYESPQMWRVYAKAFNGDAQVADFVKVQVKQGNRKVRFIGDDDTFWTPLGELNTWNSVLLVEKSKGTYTITVTASNGIIGTGSFVIQ